MPSYALIAEPEPGRASGLLALLAGEGLESTVVRDGAEAQEVVRQRGAPALLVTDLSLPRVDGFALLTWLRERSDASGTQVVVVTAFDELRVRAWQLKDVLGIHSLLSRRAPADLVRDTVRRVMAGQRAPVLEPVVEPSAEQERQRLARIDSMRLVDEGPPEAELQALVTEVAQAFSVPVALLSLVLGDRQWFKAHVGLPPWLAQERGTPQDWAFCHHVVQGHESLVVPDAARHPVFRDNPLVRDGIVGSYAGAPLRTSSGEVLGSLCVIDTRPMVLGAEDLAALRELARRVAGDLETLSDPGSAPSQRDERERLLRVDALTGLDTRRAGEERLWREIGRCRRDGLACGVLLVDLVGLGPLNATRGIDAGDAALRDVARRLEGLGGPSGFAVRWEGGTLLVALPGVDAIGTEALRQQLQGVRGAPEVVTAAVAVEGEEDPRHTLARARAALARAKAEHRPVRPG
jgi:diguanylate cyclase (GGDEF)-like protein